MSEFGGPAQSNFGNSTAYAAAVQRARQIAAKINPNGGGDTAGKRELEDGFQPETKKLATEIVNSNAPVNRPPGGPPAAPGMGYVPEGGAITEEIQVPDRIVGLIIGRGGEQITRLQAESGCKIQMERSRGTNERTCTLTGSREAIGRAKDMVMNLVTTLSRSEGGAGGGFGDVQPPGSEGFLNQSGPGMGGGGGGGPPGPGGRAPGSYLEIMIPAPKVGLIIGKGGETIKNLQDTSGCKMVVMQDSNTPEHEKPLIITGNPPQVERAKDLVYQLLAEKEGGRRMDRGDRGGGGFGGGQNNFDFGGGGGHIEILVPRAAVGVVIGKGGEMIKKIQAETGAKLQFEQGREEGPGDRKCILTGKPPNCEDARARVEELIDSVQRRDQDGPGGGRGDRRGGSDRGGQRRDGGGFDRGGGGRGDRWGGAGGGMGGPGRGGEITFAVPAHRAGFVIGRGGETIKQINAQSGAHCEIDRKQPNTNSQERIFTIRGSPEQIEEAKRLIIEKSGIDDSFNSHHNQMQQPASTAYPNQSGFQAPSGGGGGGGGWGGPNPSYQAWGGSGGPGGGPPEPTPSNPSVNPNNGQPDYTLQWAEYYRSMGMVREAEAIEAQAKNKQVAQPGGAAPGLGAPAAAQPAPTPQANGGQPDYSAQWAEYYRSMGKMKEAEAIEAQIKSKAPAGGAGAAPGAGMIGGQQPGAAYGQYGAAAGYPPQPTPSSAYYGGPAGGSGAAGGYGGYQAYPGGYGPPGGN